MDKTSTILYFLLIISLFSGKVYLFVPLLILVIFWPQIKKLNIKNKFMDPQTIRMPDTSKVLSKLSGSIGIIVIAFIVIIVLIKSIVIIPAGHTGVYHLFGKVRDAEISSGIHLINPLATITKMDIRTLEYTMSIAYGEGKKAQADEIKALTKEGLTVDLDITVLYRLMEESSSEVYRTVGLEYEEIIIRPEIRSVIREVVAQYDAKDIYSDKRSEVAAMLQEILTSNIEKRGILVETVLLRNVNLPPQLTKSIEEKLTADQEAQKYDFYLLKEAKEADRKRIEAEGQRDAQRIINESLTARYLEYLYLQGLKDRPGTIYVPTSPNNGLPMFRNIQ